ncbi:hypothetical protein FW764_01250 [Pseudomonas sp. 1152_12]
MSITQLKDALNAHLPDSSPVAVPLGDPVAVASTLSVARNDGVETGIWDIQETERKTYVLIL